MQHVLNLTWRNPQTEQYFLDVAKLSFTTSAKTNSHVAFPRFPARSIDAKPETNDLPPDSHRHMGMTRTEWPVLSYR